MEVALATSAVKIVLGKIADLTVTKVFELYGVSDEVELMRVELTLIQGVMEDVGPNPNKESRAVENWLIELRRVAESIQKVIETFENEIPKGRWTAIAKNPKKLNKVSTHIQQITKILKILYERGTQLGITARATAPLSVTPTNTPSAEVVQITQILNQITQIFQTHFEHEHAAQVVGTTTSATAETLPLTPPNEPSDVDDPEVFVGHESVRRDITRHLLDQSIPKRTVLSIVGIGGLGKTTLAHKIYNSYELNRRQFQCRAWMSISQTFDKNNVLREILYKIKSAMKDKNPPLEDKYLVTEVKGYLRDKRYLIVLDDVWTKDLWDMLKNALLDSQNCSRVIITTRNADVAKSADRKTIYQLGALRDEESVALLFRTALQSPDIEPQAYPLPLRDVAQKLIKKCGGLPLALVVLGGILSTEEDNFFAWNRVYETMDWHDGDGQKCMKTLEKSYEALPNDHLKQCFRSLGDFPEDYDFSAELITRLWVAEELIPKPGGGTLEEQAEKYLQELVKRCLVQVTEISNDGYCRSFRMHDLLREIAIRKTREGKLPPYRVVQQYGSFRNDDDLDSRNTHLLLCFGVDMSNFNYQGFEDLRVLLFQDVKWGNIDMSSLRNWLEGLVHLRYLGFRHIRSEGETFLWNVSFGRLKCLETLDCSSTHVIPNPSLWGIPTLRHVIGHRIHIKSNEDSPLNWSCLKNLQTLNTCLINANHIPTVECNLNLRTLKIYIFNGKDETRATEGWQRLETLLSRAGYLVSLSLGAYPLTFLDISRNFGLPCYEKIQSLRLSGIWTSVPSVEMFPN